MNLHKYPRTPHVQGSKLQPGDFDLSQIPFRTLADCYLVIEEKVDGANAGISFDDHLQLQSRGHFLTGGEREKHFALFKTWAVARMAALRAVLGRRYVMYGEWLYAKHTIAYDALPHYFLEFDMMDRETGAFLDTPSRHALLAGTPVVSVPVLWRGYGRDCPDLDQLVSTSQFKTEYWRDHLQEDATKAGIDVARVMRETDPSDRMEGLYIKIEQHGQTVGRLKWIRASFLTSVMDSGSHWLNRPILPNRLAPHINIFGD